MSGPWNGPGQQPDPQWGQQPQQPGWGQQPGQPGGQQPGQPGGQQPGQPGGEQGQWGQPPQQPGGQQPGGQQPGWGQQPDQQPGWGQQPGQPGQPAYGQPGQFGQAPPPGQYGQPAWGQQGGQPPYGGPPPGGRNRMPFYIGGGVVALIVIIALVAFFVTRGGDGGSSPTAAVKKLVSAVNSKNVSDAKSVLCAKDRDSTSSKDLGVGDSETKDLKFKVGDETKKDDTHATVKLTISATVSGTPSTQTVDMPVVKEDGKWKVCPSDLNGSSSNEGTSGTSTGSSQSTDGNGGGDTTESDSPSSPSPSPTSTDSFELCERDGATGVAIAFMVALELKDLDRAKNCTVNGQLPAAAQQLIGKEMSPAGESDDTSITYKVDSTGEKWKVTCVQVNGKWKVSTLVKV